MENKNLSEIFKNLPKGTTLWCDPLGEVTFLDYSEAKKTIHVQGIKNKIELYLNEFGGMNLDNNPKTELPCVLYPDQDRSWDCWQAIILMALGVTIVKSTETGELFIYNIKNQKKCNSRRTNFINNFGEITELYIEKVTLASKEEIEKFNNELNKNIFKL